LKTATRGGGTKKSSPRLFPALFGRPENLCTVACFCNTLTVSCFPPRLGLPKEDEDGAAGTFPPPATGGATVPRCARVSMEHCTCLLLLSLSAIQFNSTDILIFETCCPASRPLNYLDRVASSLRRESLHLHSVGTVGGGRLPVPLIVATIPQLRNPEILER